MGINGSNGGLYWIGMDAGSVSLNAVVIDDGPQVVYEAPYRRHFGKIHEAAMSLLQELYGRFDPMRIRGLALTGNHGRILSQELGVFFEYETIAQVTGCMFVDPGVRTIISMGGQETALLQVAYRDGQWELEHFNTNGPCASGTGSFIDQQAERLASSLYGEPVDTSGDRIDAVLGDFIRLGMSSEKPAHVACRCTVFTKSDMIHLQNKGEKLADIIRGLHEGNASNYMSTIVCNRSIHEPVVFVGGLAGNPLQVQAFRNYFPQLTVPQYHASMGALGVALAAREKGIVNRPDTKRLEEIRRVGAAFPVAPKLSIEHTRFPSDNDLEHSLAPGQCTPVFLGVDVGSTTTKHALITEDGRIVHKDYVQTRGRPIEVVQKLLSGIRRDLGETIRIIGVATTGSGRYVVGDFLNADLIIDEITAHARGAVEIDPLLDTIFEIGGQDSKYISLSNTHPLDFDMNKVCAAGTGSFLHELANKNGIQIVGEFQDLALSSESPVRLTERCTVFMESDLVSYAQQGADRRDLMAGLCYAVVHNYLNRVVERRKVGKRVMFLGGPSLNKGVVAAFERVLGRELVIPKHREVLGAYGAALSVRQRMQDTGTPASSFRGIDSAVQDSLSFEERVCHADPHCHNECKLKVYDFDGRKSVWGGECGRYEVVRASGKRPQNYFKIREKIFERYLEGIALVLDPEDPGAVSRGDGAPTVGIQRALYGLQTGVLWAHFFHALGYRPVFTGPTDNAMVREGIESMTAETCFPVKVSHGHVKRLSERTDHCFLPSMINLPTLTEKESGFFCPLVQANHYMTRTALNLDRKRILSPTVHMKEEPDVLALELADHLGPRLGVPRKAVRRALHVALERQEAFEEEMRSEGQRLLKDLEPGEYVLVVTGRAYNLYDDRVNLRLGQNLAKIGVRGVPMDFLDFQSVDLSDFPNMYWGSGAAILRTAKLIRNAPHFFGLHMTNFSCGADSFLEHFYRHVMGDKPYLILELDEHSAVAGVMTRLEAYKNVIENTLSGAKHQEGKRAPGGECLD